MTAETRQLPVHDIIEWDVLNWSQLIRYWQPVLEQLPKSVKVLAVGERSGGLSLWLALMGFDVVCSDITEPSAKAANLHKQYGVAHKITYSKTDIVNTDEEGEQYDVIIAKSVIGGLKAERADAATRNFAVQQKAIENIHRLLKPGGYFFSAENMQGGVLIRNLRRILGRDKGWRHFSYNELKELYKGFALVQTKTFGILPTFFSHRVFNYVTYLINRYLLLFLPAESKYIAFTMAQK